MCRHPGAGDQEGECWDEMMGSDEPSRTRDVSGARMGLLWGLACHTAEESRHARRSREPSY